MIHEILGRGKESARTGRELAAYFKCNIREITEQIERERRDGWQICATMGGQNPGYYLAADAAELQEYCGQLTRRAGAIMKTRRLMTTARETTGRA